MAASTADDDELDNNTEFYAEIILTCRGQFDDPCLDSRLDDITNQLHTLSKDNNRPLVVDVRPWNSVRVTLKVSRETASALQRLAQRRDPKLTDIGILSVQVDGGSVLHLNHDQEVVPDAAQSATTLGIATLFGVPDCSHESAVNLKSLESSMRLGNPTSLTRPPTFPGSCQHDTASQNIVTSRTPISSSPSKSNISTGCKDNAWHPLEGRHASSVATAVPSSDSSSCFWNQMSSDWRHNGLNSDPFQFSADDLLTRMLADVPAPKQRRQRLRNGSSASDLLRFDVNSSMQNPMTTRQNDTLCLPPSAVDVQNKHNSLADNQFNTIEHGWPQRSVNPAHYGELKDRRHNSSHDFKLASGRSYVEKNLIDNKSVIFPVDHSNVHKEKEMPFNSGRGLSGNQPIKRRRANVRTSSTDLLRDDAQKSSSVADMNSAFAHHQYSVQRDNISIDSCRINSSLGQLQSAPEERLSIKPPTRITSDQPGLQHVGYHPLHAMTSYPVSTLGHGSAQDTSVCSSSYLSASHESSSVSGFSSADTHYHQTIASVSDMPSYSGSGAKHPTRSRYELERTGLSLPMTSIGMHAISSNTSCTADVRNRVSPYLPSYVSAMTTSLSALYSGSSPVDTSCMIHSTGPDAGTHMQHGFGDMDSLVDRNPSSMSTTTCTASPHETWTSGELDYFGACGADSGIASNTSLSVGSDHSENDRACTETALAECSVKRSPMTHTDHSIMSPSIPGVECSNRSSTVSGKDMKCITAPMGMLSDEASSPCAGRNSWSDMSPFSASRQLTDCAFTSTGADTSKTSEPVRLDARQRFIRKSRQTPSVVAECPPAITCPSLPRRLSESVKRAMRGVGELPNPPLAASPCDSGPTKVVIRITKTRCNGGNEAKRSKHKEQWSVQPILKPLVQSAECPLEISHASAAGTVAVDVGYHSPQLSNKLSCKSSSVNEMSNHGTLDKIMNCNQMKRSDDLTSFDPANRTPANVHQSPDILSSLDGGTFALNSNCVQQDAMSVDSKTPMDCSVSE